MISLWNICCQENLHLRIMKNSALMQSKKYKSWANSKGCLTFPV